MSGDSRRGERFRYEGWTITDDRLLTLDYSVDGRRFTERVRFESGDTSPHDSAVSAAARLVFLLAGVSYYKTAAPSVIDLGDTAVTDDELEFLRSYYVDGLAEFAYKNEVDLSGLVFEARTKQPAPAPAPSAGAGRPLVPFGGGIDSIVVVERTRAVHRDTALFVASREGARFEAIETAAAVTGLPVRRADRTVDEQVLRSRENNLLNGHVPVTGILSTLAVVTAVLDGRDSVVMSNEWSASSGTVELDGRVVNHQWSKSADFEAAFRRVLAGSITGLEYFSALRPYSELWVAQRMAELPRYHRVFRSCNRAFHLDPARRLDRWCGECDKCCFIDLILAPFLGRAELEQVFDGREPLANPALAAKFRSLLGDPLLVKPFECVGDEGECRAAVVLAAARPDRAGTAPLQQLAAEVRVDGRPIPAPETLMHPMGAHFIPSGHPGADDLV